MSWRAPVVSAVLAVDNFYEPFLDSSGNIIIIRPKPREVVHFTLSVGTLGATDTLDWEVLGGNRIVTGGDLDGIGSNSTFVSSEVDDGDDHVTFGAAHGIFSTGDGPYKLTTTDTLPDGLGTGPEYFIIVASMVNVRFATTRANALAGTPITISTGSGAGTHTLVPPGSIDVNLDTTADTQADDYYNEMYLCMTSGLAADELRLIANFANSGDQAELLHSTVGVAAATDTYDIYALSRIVDGSGSITTVAATVPVEASPMNDEFGASGYPVLIPRARASGGTDAHKVIMAYTIDGVDA